MKNIHLFHDVFVLVVLLLIVLIRARFGRFACFSRFILVVLFRSFRWFRFSRKIAACTPVLLKTNIFFLNWSLNAADVLQLKFHIGKCFYLNSQAFFADTLENFTYCIE